MTSRGAVAVGLALYVVLVLAFYGVHQLALPDGSGLYPVWYSGGDLLLNAVKAVGPGFAAGWLRRERGLRTGVTVGVVGGLFEVAILVMLTGVPFAEVSGRITVAAVYTLLAAALANAVGGAAGEFLRDRRYASNPLIRPPAYGRRIGDQEG
jgi:hypothetical protein